MNGRPILSLLALIVAIAPSPDARAEETLALLRHGTAHASICSGSAARDTKVQERTEQALRALFARDAAREDELDPLSALYRGDVGSETALERIFTDALERDRLASAQRSLADVEKIDPCALPNDLRLSQQLFSRRKQREIESLRPEIRIFEGDQPINHFGGIHVDFPSLIAPDGVFAYQSADDYRAALRVYHAFPAIVDNAISRFRQGMAQRITEPRLTVQIMIDQIDAVLDQPDNSATFLDPLTVFPADMPEADRRQLGEAFRTSTQVDILPAYRRLRDFLHEEYLPAARDTIGLSDMPGGTGLYRALIARETTLPLDPDEIHALGLREVSRIEEEMTKVASQLGNKGSLPQFFEEIRNDRRFHPSSAKELQQRFASVARTVNAQLPRFFETTPRTPLMVEPYPAWRARYEAGGSYSEGTQADTPATFFYNTYDLKHRFLSGVTTLYLHEGMPGHHMQISLARENNRLPAFQRYSDNNAFVEGWALYAETLGYDMGLYRDPLQHWGTLDDEMLRAMRLVVDTGIHARHWSRQQAIDYMLTHSGMGRSDAEAEVDRYIALPAQALSYKIGAITIQNLRREAEARLGSRFDIRAFHKEVIGSGALPLDILQEKIESWLAAQTVSSPARRAR